MDYLASHLAQPLSRDAAADALDVAIDSLVSFTDDVDESVSDLTAHLARPTNEEVEAFKNWVLSNSRTPEWSAVIDRINDGELTWEAIASGDADRDPGVDAAMRSIPKVDRTVLSDPASLPMADPQALAAHRDVHQLSTASNDDVDEYDDYDGFTFRA